jgi:hypothetical protein
MKHFTPFVRLIGISNYNGSYLFYSFIHKSNNLIMSNLFSFARFACMLLVVALFAFVPGVVFYVGIVGPESEVASILVNYGYISILAMFFIIIIGMLILEVEKILESKQLQYEINQAKKFAAAREVEMAAMYKKQWIEKRWNELLIETSKPIYVNYNL